MEDSGEVHNKQIHELTEIYDESSGFGRRSTNSKARQQVVMIDGWGYEARQTIGRKGPQSYGYC